MTERRYYHHKEMILCPLLEVWLPFEVLTEKVCRSLGLYNTPFGDECETPCPALVEYREENGL